jgi:hypothetical protein
MIQIYLQKILFIKMENNKTRDIIRDLSIAPQAKTDF